MIDPHGKHSAAAPRKLGVAPRALKYAVQQEHLLRRIGGALVMHWDELPDELQDLLIDQAAVTGDRETARHEAADIENFVRSVKTVSIAKTPEGA